MKPGDLVFFHGLGHVGIYIGHGRMIHAPQEHGAHARQSRRERAQDVRAPAAVEVHDVRPLAPDQAVQAPREERIDEFDFQLIHRLDMGAKL